MPRGPLPKPAHQRRRRNAPTIPTTILPRAGREGRAPTCPYKLDKAGRAWWRWAWKTPQSCGWDEVGHLYVVARRAQLEDDLHAVEASGLELTLDDVLDPETCKAISAIVSTLKRMAAGKLNVVREMREIDERLGLTPKGMAALRWEIRDMEPDEDDGDTDADEDELGIDQFSGLRAVG